MNGTANPYYFIDKKGNIINLEGHKMTLHKTVAGYLRVKLSRGCKRGMYSVHRLVGNTFLDNSENYPVINHIDGVKDNNCVENLEWCTHQHNNLHTIKLNGKPTHCCKKIDQIDLVTGEIVASFDSMTEAMEVTGIQKTNISKVCRGERPYAGGYFWKYK